MGMATGMMLALAVVLGGSGSGSTTNTTSPNLATPSFGTQSCQKKRVDACGCHHVYGVRHCHPKRKSEHCEVMAVREIAPVVQEPNGEEFAALVAERSE
jgi:hypothetical protein